MWFILAAYFGWPALAAIYYFILMPAARWLVSHPLGES